MLVPGFYTLRYQYSTGTSAIVAPACNYFGVEGALQRVPRQRGADTRRLSVHIDADLASLHPEVTGRDGEEKALWYGPERIPENEIKLDRMPRLPTMGNAVDFCIDTPANVPVTREILFKVDRSGLYWVTFVAGGAADGDGGRISNVQLLARGTSPPSNGLPRLVRSFDPADPLNPSIGAWVSIPHGAGAKAPYKVQLQ